MMTSHCAQPSAAISARVVGRKVAGVAPATRALLWENRGVALCTPAIRPEAQAEVQQNPLSDIDRIVDLGVFALHQQSNVMPGPRDLALQVRDGCDPHSVDAQQDIAGLQTGGQCRPADVLNQQAALGVQFLLFAGLQRSQHQSEFAAAILARVARDLSRRVLEQYGLHRDLGGFAIVPDPQARLAAGRQLRNDGGEIPGMIDVASIDTGNDIAGFQTRLLARTGRIDRTDECTVRCGETEGQRELLADVLHRHADAAANHLAVLLQLLLDVQRQVNRNGKRYAHVTAGAAVDLGIDTDHFAIDVKQRTARIPGVHGSIGLNEGDVAGLLTAVIQRTAKRTDDARGDAVFKSERRTNGNGPLARAQLGGVTEAYRRQAGRGYFDQR